MYACGPGELYYGLEVLEAFTFKKTPLADGLSSTLYFPGPGVMESISIFIIYVNTWF